MPVRLHGSRMSNFDAQAPASLWAELEADRENVAEPGDLLFAWSGSLDVYRWPGPEALINQHIFKVEENRDLVDRRFLYYALRAVMGTIRSQIHGSTMNNVSP